MMAGDSCTCCARERESRNERHRYLKEVRRRTIKKRLQVLVCEHCDGPVLELGRRENPTTDLNLDASTRPDEDE